MASSLCTTRIINEWSATLVNSWQHVSRRRKTLCIGLFVLLFVGSLCYRYVDFRLVRTLEGHADDIRALAFSPDGKWLASGGDDRSVCLWEVSTGNRLKSFHSARPISSLCFLPNHQGLLYADGTSVTGISLPEGNRLHNFALPGGNVVTAVTVSSDGQRIAVGGCLIEYPLSGDAIETGVISIWDRKTNTLVEPVRSFSKIVECCVISPDGRRIAYTLGNEGYLAEIGSSLDPQTIEWGDDYCFTPDGKFLVIERGGEIVRYDIESEEVVSQSHHGNDVNLVNGIGIAVSPDGTLLARATIMGELMTWTHGGVQVISLADLSLTTAYHSNDHRYGRRGNYMASVAISPDGKQVAGGSARGKIHIWNLPH